MLRFITIEVCAFQTSSTGMPAIGLAGSSCAAGLTMSLAPMTIETSVGEVVVDLVHLQHDVVGHLGLGSSTFMCPGMRPATGWMPKRTLTPFSRSMLGDLEHRVLRLRDGHAVAGHDDDVLRLAQHLGGLGGADRRHLAGRLRRAAGSGRRRRRCRSRRR